MVGVLPDDPLGAELHDPAIRMEFIAAMAVSSAVTAPRSSGHATDARTLPEMVLRSTAVHEGSALRFWRDGRWAELSYAELATAVREIACGLIALGIHPGERVSILSGTRPEWTLADLGALCAGAVVAPIYHSDPPEECQYILEHADSRLVFCEDAEQLAKVVEVREQCPQHARPSLVHAARWRRCRDVH